MHVHLIGVCGAGMSALARLLIDAGHKVSGSDTAFDPPVGPILAGLGVETMRGWDPAHLAGSPDLVVIGNVCRPDNPEARAAIDRGLSYTSMAGALQTHFLTNRKSFVVAGTHGKTTTASLLSFLLNAAGKEPGFFIGAAPLNFGHPARIGGTGAPFVLEGDEYDSAFFEKTPKFWRYEPWAAAITAIEHDHIDIYPDESHYLEAFERFVDLIPEDGLLAAWAGDPNIREVCARARCRLRFYAVTDDDCGAIEPAWKAKMLPDEAGMTRFELEKDQRAVGSVVSPLTGHHNVRNSLAAMILATEGALCPVPVLIEAMPRFTGVRRRQELLGVVDGVRVYDDFAHHPTAVFETVSALRRRHRNGRLIAAFEPRSATASRRLHQAEYPTAFTDADLCLLAPVGRKEIAAEERLDTAAIAEAINTHGGDAYACDSIDALVDAAVGAATSGDTIVLMSNGTFGGAPRRILEALSSR